MYVQQSECLKVHSLWNESTSKKYLHGGTIMAKKKAKKKVAKKKTKKKATKKKAKKKAKKKTKRKR